MIPALIDYLAVFAHAGNMAQVEVIARSMLASIPEDLVALQFLGLALYQRGRLEEAYRAFKKVAARLDRRDEPALPSIAETASAVSYREATRANSGLAESWYRIAQALKSFGFHKPADHAFKAGLASGGTANGIPVRAG